MWRPLVGRGAWGAERQELWRHGCGGGLWLRGSSVRSAVWEWGSIADQVDGTEVSRE
jgi:hypothetical protein